jgi:hypothetical protein
VFAERAIECLQQVREPCSATRQQPPWPGADQGPSALVLRNRPGGYAFGGDWKLGLLLLIWLFVVSVFLVPLIWRF